MYSSDSRSTLQSDENRRVPEVEEVGETEENESVGTPSSLKSVAKELLEDKIRKPNNMILPSKLAESKDKKSADKKGVTGSKSSVQNKNIGIRINKTTTVNNPSNEKVQQARLQMENQKINQDAGRPDPNLIPKAPEPMKPVGLFKR